jgi:subtilase family serine protease
MDICTRPIGKLALLAAVFLFSVLPSRSQTNLITQPVDETKLTTLRGNTHPLARPEFDRGVAPTSLSMNHLLLVLKRSPAQEAALEKLLAEQQDRSSPNYHKWLTPAEFGQQFGASEQDIQKISSWLESHGFTVEKVANGRNLIDFSGTVGNVQAAFHTTIHRYVLANGEQHWANASDPQIPVALSPVIAGVNKLNDFRPKPMNHVIGEFKKSLRSAKSVPAAKPQFNYPGDCYGSSTNCYAVGPYDFATIYNVLPLWKAGTTGTGQNIAIVSDSDVFDSDYQDFRSLLGLPPLPGTGGTINRVLPTGSNPGVQNCQENSDEQEAILDVEWAGAVAPGAAIDLVISPSEPGASCSAVPNQPGFGFGGDYSAVYAIDNNIAPILSNSYGACELSLGSSQNAFYNTEWSQAASEGITVVVASGDEGSAGCDSYDTSGDETNIQPAEFGLEVNGFASTPYNVAVGGTDFNYANFKNPSQYWSTSNTTSGTTQTASALGYIPEMVWNDTCTNQALYQSILGYSSAANACNSATLQEDGYFIFGPIGSEGGMSNCTTPSGSVPADCSGGYAKPSWQTGPGVPNDGKRDIPDISLFGAAGEVSGTAYIVCEADLNPEPEPCSLTNQVTIEGEPAFFFLAEGGTSVSAQAFAGVMALVTQKFGKQGLANPTLYSLAAEQSPTSCNASTPASTCVFNDVTVGTNAMPCASGTSNCNTTGTNAIGELSGYNAGVGYDLATGLGTVNVANLASAWGPNFYLSSSSPAVSVASPGSSGNLPLTVTAVNGFTGTVTLACAGLPTGATCTFSPTSVSLTSSATSAMVAVTVNTTAPSALVPASRPTHVKRTPGDGPMALASLCFAALLLTYFYGTPRRWVRTGLALVAFSVLILVAGCGGGGGSTPPPSNGGTPAGTTTVSVTGANGNISSVMTFQLTVQ